MSIIKFLKIGLPIATATSATIFTTLLVSEKKNQLIKLENLDNPLNDFELPDEKFEDEQKFYTKDEEDKAPKEVNEETKQKITNLLDDLGKSTSAEELAQKMKNFKEDMEKIINEKVEQAKSSVSSEEKGRSEATKNSLQKPASDEGVNNLQKAKEEEAGDNNSGAITKEDFSDVLTLAAEGDDRGIQYLESTLESPKKESETELSSSSQEASHKSSETDGSELEPTGSIKEEGMQEGDSSSDFQERKQESLNSELSDSVTANESTDSSNIGNDQETSSGKKQLTQEEIQKWQKLGDELSSVSERLKYLFN